jgi:hypothetical protein
MFSETLFAGSILRQGNTMAQGYAKSFVWAHAHPIKRIGDAHETLSLVFQRDGVPPTMVTDDSKEQTKGEFRHKLKDRGCIHKKIAGLKKKRIKFHMFFFENWCSET